MGPAVLFQHRFRRTTRSQILIESRASESFETANIEYPKHRERQIETRGLKAVARPANTSNREQTSPISLWTSRRQIRISDRQIEQWNSVAGTALPDLDKKWLRIRIRIAHAWDSIRTRCRESLKIQNSTMMKARQSPIFIRNDGACTISQPP